MALRLDRRAIRRLIAGGSNPSPPAWIQTDGHWLSVCLLYSPLTAYVKPYFEENHVKYGGSLLTLPPHPLVLVVWPCVMNTVIGRVMFGSITIQYFHGDP